LFRIFAGSKASFLKQVVGKYETIMVKKLLEMKKM